MINDKVKKTEVDKDVEVDYHQVNKNIASVKIKVLVADRVGNKSYIFNEHDSSGKLLSLNRYCIVGSAKQPFEELTLEEELVLNPLVEEPE